MPLDQFKTQVLLLHSQQSTLDRLSAGFTDSYSVHCATSGTEALLTLGETPIHIIVTAQDLPGMSGLEALREAKKRSPETIGILLAGNDTDDGLEALVGDQEVFQIVRGTVEPDGILALVESAHKRARLLALAESANDTSANVDEHFTEHIVMETSENGATIISDGTGRMPALRPDKIQISPGVGGRDVDVLVLTKDEEFLGTIKDSARGLHNVHHALTTTQADEFVRKHKVGVLVTDAAMAEDSVQTLTQRLRKERPRLVAIVAGRRDDGETLMDMINKGHVYRFLLKPVSPGRARLAIEASVKHHLEAPDEAFKPKSGFASLFSRKSSKASAEADAKRKAEEEAKRKAEAEAKRKAEEEAKRKAEAEAKRKAEEEAKRKAEAEAKRKAEEEAKRKAEAEAKRKAEEEAKRKAEAEAKRKAEEEAKRKAEEEARRKAEAEAKRKAEEEARRRAEEEARRRAEEEARRKAEEEARRKAEEEARRKAEEEARRKAEEEARRKAEEKERARKEAEEKERARKEAERRKREKAEAKAKARAEADARKQEKAEAKARAKAEAAARKQAKTEARAKAKAEAEARKAATRIEPTMSADGLDSAFGGDTSFTDTMTGIAASIGQSVSGVAGSAADGAQDILGALGSTAPSRRKPILIGLGGVVVVAIAVTGWLAIGGDSVPVEDATVESTVAAPGIREPAEAVPPTRSESLVTPAVEDLPAISGAERPAYASLLERARAARDNGNVISPGGDNAIELYAAVVDQAPDDSVAAAEFDSVIDDALGIAERAILARNPNEADLALDMVRFASPENGRLTFLRVQVNELLFRDHVEQARLAIRERRFEDAGRLISEARSVSGSDSGEVDLLTEELNAARSQQQIGETLATASARLDEGSLITPANDNARYYFELALSGDPDNQVASQGLVTIASKLVLQARTAIDDGRLDDAERLLSEAAEIDPSSDDLGAVNAALTAEREAIAEAARQAELARQAEIERQAELRRQEEARLRAEAEERERQRIAEEQRRAAAEERARIEAEERANRAATASPLGVGAAAPKPVAANTPAPSPATTSPAPQSSPVQAAAMPESGPVQATATPESGSVQATARPDAGTQRPSPEQSATQPTREPQVQRQAANAVNVSTDGRDDGSVSRPQEPELVPVSSLTRINYVGPEYPRAARRRNITGAVDVGFIVTTDGRVRSLSVIKSEPGDTFDQAAMDAVEQWRFEPVIENGVAVEKRSAVRLSFNLQ